MNGTQKMLWKRVRDWLESKGYEVLITGGKREMVVPVSDIFPLKNYMTPDVVAISEKPVSHVCIVEVETSLRKIYEAIVKCMIWKTMATLSYLAYPKEKCKNIKVLSKYGIGLLSVSDSEVEEVVKILPKEARQLPIQFHPVDYARELELRKLIKRIMDSR